MTTTETLEGRWAAAGPSGEDIAYRTQTLRFTGMELTLDESVPLATLFRLWVNAAAAAGLIFFVFFLLAIMGLVTGGSMDSPDAAGAAAAGFTGLLGLGALLSTIAFWVVLLLVTMEEPVAEWKTLIEGKAAAAESSYAAIYHSLARRQIPVGVSASRIRSDLLSAESVNNRLVITERSYVAYVSVFAFGTSLYVGWTMWRSRRGFTLVGHFVKDLIGGLLGRSGAVNQMLRTERVRAMREAVHSAVREGVDAAVEGISMPIAATFGYEIPIESASAPAPVASLAPGMPRQPVGRPVRHPAGPAGS